MLQTRMGLGMMGNGSSGVFRMVYARLRRVSCEHEREEAVRRTHPPRWSMMWKDHDVLDILVDALCAGVEIPDQSLAPSCDCMMGDRDTHQ